MRVHQVNAHPLFLFFVLLLSTVNTAVIVDARVASPDKNTGSRHLNSDVTTNSIQHVYQVEIGDINNNTVSPGDKLAVRSCAGLLNRDDQLAAGGSAVYILERSEDPGWYADTTIEFDGSVMDAEVVNDPRIVNTTRLGVADFLSMCLANRNAVKGYIHYSFSRQQIILPNILTLVGVLDAIPIDVGDLKVNMVAPEAVQNAEVGRSILDDLEGLPLLFDALTQFGDQTPLEVTQYMFENYASQTTAMAKLNPGYKSDNGALTPTLIAGNVKEFGTSDFVVKERLFAFYLWYSCIPTTDEGNYYSGVMTNPATTPWKTPMPVYGYDLSFLVFSGTLWEATTHCGTNFNTGAIPTGDVNNLSFFNRKKVIPNAAVLPAKIPVQDEEIVYDPTKTYLAFIIGDGDNIHMVKHSRKKWMNARTKHCGERPADEQPMSLAMTTAEGGTEESGREVNRRPYCGKLLWALSPRIMTMAPDLYTWFQEQAKLATNGKDTFILPPSGHFYAYPSLMNNADQAEYVRLTEKDAVDMDTNAMVAWEIAGSWGNAMTEYFPRYLNNSIIDAVFAVNVPYMVPITSHPFVDTYRILEQAGTNKKLAVFETFFWRGIDDASNTQLSVPNMAQAINNYPEGLVNSVYCSSDNGFEIDYLLELYPLLDDHVVIVDSKQLASLAFQRGDSNPTILDGLIDTVPDLVEDFGDLITGIFPSSSENPDGGVDPNDGDVNPDDDLFGF